MKCEIPGCEPRVFPLVRHRHDIGGDQVTPTTVTAALAALRRRRLERIAIQPFLHIEVVELLAPQHPGKGLTLYTPHVPVADVFLQISVEGIRLDNASREHAVEIDERIWALSARAQPHSNGDVAAGRNRAQVKSGRLCTFPGRIHRLGAAVDDVLVERILEVALPRADTEQSNEIGLIVTE